MITHPSISRRQVAQSLQEETTAKLALKDAEIVILKDEIARLKGLPPRPKFGLKPSGMEGATTKSSGKKARKRPRGLVRDKVVVTSEVTLKAAAVPPGARFKGYEDVLVQDLRIAVEVVRYRRERWETTSGERIVAPLPSGILGGFGPELRRFIAAGHFHGQVTACSVGAGCYVARGAASYSLHKGAAIDRITALFDRHQSRCGAAVSGEHHVIASLRTPNQIG